MWSSSCDIMVTIKRLTSSVAYKFLLSRFIAPVGGPQFNNPCFIKQTIIKQYFLIVLNWGFETPKQYNKSKLLLGIDSCLNHITETHNVNVCYSKSQYWFCSYRMHAIERVNGWNEIDCKTRLNTPMISNNVSLLSLNAQVA